MKKEQFEAATKWQDETFPNANTFSKIAHLAEEVGELYDSINKKESFDRTVSEFADCFILLFGAASKFGLSYEQICVAIDRKMEINKKRKWGKPDENGVVNHIKEEFVCKVCGKPFINNKDLFEHVDEIHNKGNKE